ncbi:MAG TPA: hypothetical protein PLS67_12360 [Accumulibacter sp.]|jgi:hypothetical protein|nr:hypothetical protein [Accumulibacter sp.]
MALDCWALKKEILTLVNVIHALRRTANTPSMIAMAQSDEEKVQTPESTGARLPAIVFTDSIR